MSALKRILSALALAAAGIVAAVLLIEIGLRIVPESTWKTAISRGPDRHILFRQDRNIGWVHAPNASMNWTGSGEYNVDVQINSLGLRDRERTYAKPPGTFRVLVLGDSFVEAIQVPLEQTFAARLETCLAGRSSQPVEVINAGVAGYGPGEALLYFTHEGVKFQPDLVLLAIFIGNDIRNMQHELGTSLLEVTGGYEFYLEDGRLQQRWVDWANPNYELPFLEQFLRRYSKIYYILKSPDSLVPHRWEDVAESWLAEPAGDDDSPAGAIEADPPDRPDFTTDPGLMIFARGFPDNPLIPPNIRTMWGLFSASLLELNRRVDDSGSHLAVVIIPRGQQVHQAMYEGWVAKYTGKFDGLRREDWDVAAPNTATHELLQSQGVPTLDLLPGFLAYDQAHDDLLYFSHDGHFNEKGHEVAADLMCDWLMDAPLAPLANNPTE